MNNQPISRKDRLAEFTLTPESSEIQDRGEKARIKAQRETHIEDISTDYTLPDYLPEIKKLLGASVSLSPLSRYISAGEAEFSGQAEYDILYSTPEGRLASARIGCDFDYSVPIILSDYSGDAGVDAISDIESESVNVRVTAPRRVNIKNRLKTTTDIYCKKNLGDNIPHTAGTEILTSRLVSSSVFRYMSEVIDVGEVISPDNENKIKNPIRAEAYVTIKDTSCEENGILVKGDVVIKLLYEDDEEKQKIITRKIPISELITADGIKPSDISNSHGKCSEVKLNISEDSIEISTEVIIEAEAVKNEEIRVIDDIFSEKYDCHTDLTPLEYETLLSSDTVVISEKVVAKSNEIGLTEVADIIDSGISLRFDGIDVDGEKSVISLAARAYLITKSRESGEFASSEFSFPVKYSLPVSSASISGNAYASPKDCNFYLDGDQVVCECDVALSYRIFSKNTVKTVSSVRFGDDYEKTACGLTVYYPQENESLWEIGKNHHVSPRRIAETNSLPYTDGRALVPKDKKYLIIS